MLQLPYTNYLFMSKIGILGLGWLGKPLANQLLKQGHDVKGSTTSGEKKIQLRNEGLSAFQLVVNSEGISGEAEEFFNHLEILILNIPPRIKPDDDFSFFQKMKHMLDAIEQYQIKKVIYVSTTGVFLDGEDNPVYNEHSQPNATSAKAKQLIKAEELIMNKLHVQATIIRFGGLVGGRRHPIYYLAGKEVNNPDAPVNLIHLYDCIDLISAVIEQNQFKQIFHGVQVETKSKSVFYTEAAEKRNLEKPRFLNSTTMGKKIVAEFTQATLGFRFTEDVS